MLDVCSVPATDMRQNQPQVGGRTHTTNTPHQGTPGQHWMSVRALSAHFFTSLHPCLTQSGTYDGVESRGWSDTHSHYSAQFTSLITPNISIERPGAHLADGPTQDAAMAKHTPCLRDFTEVHGYRPNIPGVPLKPELRVSVASIASGRNRGRPIGGSDCRPGHANSL